MSFKIASLIAEIGANTSGLENGLSRAQSLLQSAKGAMENSAKGLSSSLGSLMTPANLQMASAAFAVTSAAVSKAFDFSKEGAQLLRLEESFEGVAASYKRSGAEILMAVREASRGTISDTDIMLAANRSMLLGVSHDAEEMAAITQVAILRGRAMGLESSEAIEKVFTGIGRLSPKILDDLGIITNATARYKEYATAHGISAQAIDDFTKREIIKQAIIEDGERLMRDSNMGFDDAASSFERLDVAQQNYADQYKKNMAETFTPFNEYLTKVIDKESKLLGIQKQLQDEGFRGDQYALKREALRKYEEEVRKQRSNEAYSSRMSGLAGMYPAAPTSSASGFGQVASDMGIVLDIGLKLSDMTEDYTNKLAEMNVKLEDASQKYGEYGDKTNDVRGQIQSLQAAHATAFETMALKTLEQKDASEMMMLDYARASGLITQQGYDQAVMMDALSQAYVDGRMSAGQYANAVGGISSMVAGLNGASAKVYIDIYIREHGSSSYVGGLGNVKTSDNYNINTGKAKDVGTSVRRAAGGPVSAGNMYQVNESGSPEMLTIGGRDYLMMGRQSGYVHASNTERGGQGAGNISALVAAIPSATDNAKALARELMKFWS